MPSFHKPHTYGIRFSVTDDGEGFNTEETVQGNPPVWTGTSKASPISLHLFKRIIDAHGGVIGVDNKPGKGSVFFFEVFFPLPQQIDPVVELLNKTYYDNLTLSPRSIRLKIREAMTSPRATFSTPVAHPQSLVNIPSVKVSTTSFPSPMNTSNESVSGMTSPPPSTCLVVDDVLSNRRMTGRVLERMGYTVELACDGCEAVDLCVNKMKSTSVYTLVVRLSISITHHIHYNFY
jgi:hypothetical protein